MTAKIVSHSKVSDGVAEHLLSRIASGEWGIGHRLPGERQLAEEMGVSRVSVRAALQQLKTRGFLSAVQGGGTRVIANANTMDPALADLVKASPGNLHDLAEIRGILEIWAVRRAAANATAGQLAELAEIVHAGQADLGRGISTAACGIRFHQTIAKASGSGLYAHLMGQFRGIIDDILDRHRYQVFTDESDFATLQVHHQAIFDGIRARDPQAAAEAMQMHLDWVLARYRAMPCEVAAAAAAG